MSTIPPSTPPTISPIEGLLFSCMTTGGDEVGVVGIWADSVCADSVCVDTGTDCVGSSSNLYHIGLQTLQPAGGTDNARVCNRVERDEAIRRSHDQRMQPVGQGIVEV
jgi:hypothetical protein